MKCRNVALVLALTSIFIVQGVTGPMSEAAELPLLIAHRGNSSEAPENTMASIKSALAIPNMPNFVEIDVHDTKDGELLVIHDSSIDRTSNGKGEVSKMTLAEIRKYNAGYAKEFGDRFKDEPFPVLDDVLDAVKDVDAGVMIEVKAHGIGDDVAKRVTERGEVDKHVIASFAPDVVVASSMTNPNIRTLFLSSSGSTEEVELARRIGAKIFGSSYKDLTQEIIAQAHDSGLQVWVWTVDDPDIVLKLLNWGADGIITNRPAVMRKLEPFGG